MNKIRKMYRRASCRLTGKGYAICLDDKPIHTPLKRPLVVPTLALAEAVVAEWNAQQEWIVPSSMPLTQIANTALDRIEGRAELIIQEALHYAETELLCYRAEPASELAERENVFWQPHLDWLKECYGIEMNVTAGVCRIEQPPEVFPLLKERLERLSITELTVFQCALAAGGSLVLALALLQERIDGNQLFDLSHLEENWQIERWGEDEEARQRRENVRRDCLAAADYLALSRV